MMESKTLQQTLVEAGVILVVVAIQYGAYLYLTDADFRYSVDAALRRAQQAWKRARWERWFHQLDGWQQEAWEQVHGPAGAG